LTERKRSPTKRQYTLRERARRQEETRLRIAEAALRLHSTVGPAATTISAVAELAGVERLTVYRHFPDQNALFAACRGLHLERDPPPDPSSWRSIRDPEARLRRALGELYGRYRRNAVLLGNLRRDSDAVPRFVARRNAEAMDASVDVLLEGWRVRGPRRARTRAAIRHAADYGTWRSLAKENGLPDEEAVGLMVSLVRIAAAGR
jgi:AcrR family transcriptional regulator